MDFSVLLEEDEDIFSIKNIILEHQQNSLDNDHDDLDRDDNDLNKANEETQENNEYIHDLDPDELHDLAWETASEDCEGEEEETREDEQPSSNLEDSDSDQSFSDEEIVWDSELVLIPTSVPRMNFKYLEDGSFLPELEQHRPKKKRSMLEKAASFLRTSFWRRDVGRTRVVWMHPIPDDVPETLHMRDDGATETKEEGVCGDGLDLIHHLPESNYHKTIEIFLINGLNRYNTDFDINHKESLQEIVITAKISDRSKSAICIHASDDINKTYQKIVRSRKAEMMNKTPKELIIQLTNGLKLSSLKIEATKSDIVMRIRDASWTKMNIEVNDYYPILRKTLRNVKITETPEEKDEGRLIVNAEFGNGLSISNTDVKCSYKRCPEVEFQLQTKDTPVFLHITDGKSTIQKSFNDHSSEIAPSEDMALQYGHIKIRLINIKLHDITLEHSRIKPEENCSVVLKVLTKTNIQCIIFDQDQGHEVFDIAPTDLQIEASMKLVYPPWEFSEAQTIHINLLTGLYLNENVTCDFLTQQGNIEQVQLKIKDDHSINVEIVNSERKQERLFLTGQESNWQVSKIHIDLKTLDIEQVPITISKAKEETEATFAAILTIDVSKLYADRLKLKIHDDQNTQVKIISDDGSIEELKVEKCLVFRMDDIFKDVFNILGVYGTYSQRGTNITTFYGTLSLKEKKFATLRIFDHNHVIENVINSETNETKHNYFLRKAKDIEVDESHYNLSVFLKNISCDEITLTCQPPDVHKNISFSLAITKNHPIKVIFSNGIKTIEHAYGNPGKSVRKEVFLTDLSTTAKVVIVKLPNELNLKMVNFFWDELHDFVYNTLKQKVTVVINNEEQANILLNINASNTNTKLVTENEGLSRKSIDLVLPFVMFDGEASIQEKYTVFELEVYNNSPIILYITNGEETFTKKINVAVNVSQESRRTRQKFARELHQLEEAIKSEFTTRHKKQIEDCVQELGGIESKRKTIEEELEQHSNEAMESIMRLCPSVVNDQQDGESTTIFTFDDKFVYDEDYFKTNYVDFNHRLDAEFYEDVRSRLEGLKTEDERCVMVTGKQPSRYIERIDRVLEAIERLTPTPYKFKFEIDQKCFDHKDEALIVEAMEQIEDKTSEIEDVEVEALEKPKFLGRELTEDDLNSLENVFTPLRGKLLSGTSVPMDKARKRRGAKKMVESVESEENLYIVDTAGDVSIEIEKDVESAFKYYSEFVPNLPKSEQHHEDNRASTSKKAPQMGESSTRSSESSETADQEVEELHLETSRSQKTNAKKVQVFQCEYCPQKTAGKNHLINHQKNHNQLKKDPDYFCLFCGRRLKTNGWLQKHIDERHKDKIVIYTILNIELIKLEN